MLKRPTMKRNQVNFSRTTCIGFWQPSTTTTADFWKYYTISASDMTSFPEVTAMFDQFKINSYTFTFRPRFDNFAGNDTTDTTLPGVTNLGQTHLHIVNDPTSTVVPSGTYTRGVFNIFMEQGTVRSYNGNRTVSVTVKPYIQNTITSGSQWIKAPWLQTNASGSVVPHYGFHVFATTTNFTPDFGQSWDVFVKINMSARGLR